MRSFRKEFFMTIASDTINANLEQIRLNDANIASMQAGHITQTQTIGENLRDDTAETIAWLMQCNADLRGANAILAAAL
jgi:hypothetical protein